MSGNGCRFRHPITSALAPPPDDLIVLQKRHYWRHQICGGLHQRRYGLEHRRHQGHRVRLGVLLAHGWRPQPTVWLHLILDAIAQRLAAAPRARWGALAPITAQCVFLVFQRPRATLERARSKKRCSSLVEAPDLENARTRTLEETLFEHLRSSRARKCSRRLAVRTSSKLESVRPELGKH